jgi:hypothetical protein
VANADVSFATSGEIHALLGEKLGANQIHLGQDDLRLVKPDSG